MVEEIQTASNRTLTTSKKEWNIVRNSSDRGAGGGKKAGRTDACQTKKKVEQPRPRSRFNQSTTPSKGQKVQRKMGPGEKNGTGTTIKTWGRLPRPG